MMTNDEFWAKKFQTLYESVENDNILYKQGTVVNCFDDGESYNSFFRRALGYILDLAKDGDYQAQLVFNSLSFRIYIRSCKRWRLSGSASF